MNKNIKTSNVTFTHYLLDEKNEITMNNNNFNNNNTYNNKNNGKNNSNNKLLSF